MEFILTPLVFFLSIPIFLDCLGPEDYGIWMFVNSVIIVMQAFNLGLSFSTYKHVSTSIANGNEDQIRRTLNTNLTLTILIFLLALITTVILSLFVQHYNWFLDDLSKKNLLVTGLLCGGFTLLAKLIEQILLNVFRAYERFRDVTVISVVLKILIVSGNLLLVYFTRDLEYVFYFTAAGSLLGVFLLYGYLKKLLPSYSYEFSYDIEHVKFEVGYSIVVWMQTVAIIIVYQGDRILVSYVFGVTVLSYYAIVSTLFNHIHMVLGAMTSWLFPQIVKSINDRQIVNEMYAEYRNISLFLSVLALASFSLVSELVFTLWLGEEVFIQLKEILRWYMIFELFFVSTLIPNNFLNASGNERYNLRLVFIYTGLNLIGILIGAIFFSSIQAMLIGLVISTIIGMYILHREVNDIFGLKAIGAVSLIGLFVPSLLGAGVAFFDSLELKLVMFFACLLSLYLVHVRLGRTNFRLLLQ